MSSLADQREQYEALVPKTILELQPFRTKMQAVIASADGVRGRVTLVNLNPFISSWYLLQFDWADHREPQSYHLETQRRQPLSLRMTDAGAIRLTDPSGAACDVWGNGARTTLEQAAASGLPYAPLCGEWLYLRNPVAGHHTSLERVTDFLRDHVWGGERVITFVKEKLYRDAFMERGAASAASQAHAPVSPLAPLSAMVSAEAAQSSLTPEHLALDLDTSEPDALPGQWYPVRDIPEVMVSLITAQSIDNRIRQGREVSVNALDVVESKALVYLVAFDLQRLDLHFVLGTDHPRLDWSDRPPASSRDLWLPGPDGIDSSAPLVTNGMVSPADAERTVATFAGGFKRSHGAFHSGPFAERNHGSHYGFIEEGVVFSKLQPGLATVSSTMMERSICVPGTPPTMPASPI